MSTKVSRWGDLPRRRRDGERTYTQASGDREQVGQLKSPGSPTERPAKPYIIAFLIYELLIQVTGDRVQADTHSLLLTRVKVTRWTNVRQSGDTRTDSTPRSALSPCR